MKKIFVLLICLCVFVTDFSNLNIFDMNLVYANSNLVGDENYNSFKLLENIDDDLPISSYKIYIKDSDGQYFLIDDYDTEFEPDTNMLKITMKGKTEKR